MIAMLLAAGRGERMRPLTDHTPKPLLQAGGKSLIVWHIEKLVRTGITDLVINHAHLGPQIEETLGDGSRYGASIRYSDEGTALETAGGIAYALPMLDNEPFAVINSDIYSDYDFSHLTEHAVELQAGGDMAHLVLVDNPPHHPNGDFALNGSRIIPFPSPAGGVTSDLAGVSGQPSRMASSSIRGAGGEGVSTKLTFSGIGVYRPSLFSHISRGASAPLAPLLRAKIALGKVSGEHHRGIWMDVGTPERLDELDKLIRSSHNVS